MARSLLGKMSWERYLLRPPAVPDPIPTSLPVFIYGTAWKKDHTAQLVYQALAAGFRAVDTAAQPKHYREDLVGEGIRRAIAEGVVRREDLYIQTKFTSVQGQDLEKMPYDPLATVTEQVHASIRSSLNNLRPSTDSGGNSRADEAYIDTLVLHSPLPTMAETLEAWAACESYVPHRIRNLGISNCTLPVLQHLCTSPQVRVKPAVVQNRFYDATRYDVPLRALCREQQIIYQSFWTLTANPELVRSAPVQRLAAETDISPAAALYGLVLGLGNTTILNGTTKENHMAQDLAVPQIIERYAAQEPERWNNLLGSFSKLIGESAS